MLYVLESEKRGGFLKRISASGGFVSVKDD
jgi:hypothetical protein